MNSLTARVESLEAALANIEARLRTLIEETLANRQGLRELSLAVGGGTSGAARMALLCKTKTTISGRSGTTPGTGTVYLVTYDGDELVTRTDELEVLNGSADAEAADQYGTLLRIGNDLWYYPLDC